MVVLLTFADRKLSPTLKRITKEAQASGFFDKILAYDDSHIRKDKEYWKRYRKLYEENSRGFGYWIWKPYLIKKTFETLVYGDILVYLDAGCEIHSNDISQKRFDEYKEYASKYGIVCFDHLRCFERQYCKGDLLKFMDLQENDDFLNSKQTMGISILSSDSRTIEMVDKWFDISHNHFELVNDAPSIYPNHPDFIEHRHDQSGFSILAKQYGAKILSQIEVYPDGGDWSNMTQYPFWAKRNKVYIEEPFIYRLGKILFD